MSRREGFLQSLLHHSPPHLPIVGIPNVLSECPGTFVNKKDIVFRVLIRPPDIPVTIFKPEGHDE